VPNPRHPRQQLTRHGWTLRNRVPGPRRPCCHADVTTPTDVVDVGAVPPLRGDDAAELAAEEYRRFGELLRLLRPEEWARPTDCPAWDVHLLAAHVLGATEANAHPSEMTRQLWHGHEGLRSDIDAVNAYQVARRRDLGTSEIVRRYSRAVPAAVHWRARLARTLGRVPIRVGSPVHETWTAAHLLDVVYTRDTWMHRVDVARATGRPLRLTHDHDGRLVADLVSEWVRRHGTPVRLDLTGPAGGTFVHGAGSEALTLDAVEFARVLSGRAPGSGLLAVPVPF
jgi:uncharacterized protein (TIGR03083 family)